MLPDHNIRLQPTKINFLEDVGITGQNHDNYPPEGGPVRFDHMRMFLIGLLAQQSSYSEPTEKRAGTPWFDLNYGILRLWNGDVWKLYSQAIPLSEDSEGNVTTLYEWFESTVASLSSLAPEIIFNGISSANNVSSIGIPESLRSQLYSDSRPFVYINGALVDPRNTRLEPSSLPTSVLLVDDVLNTGDKFTISIRRIPSNTFYTSSVTVP